MVIITDMFNGLARKPSENSLEMHNGRLSRLLNVNFVHISNRITYIFDEMFNVPRKSKLKKKKKKPREKENEQGFDS